MVKKLTMNDKIERLRAAAVKVVDDANDKISKMFTAVVQEQLDTWAKEYPNHTFKSHDAMGSLSFTAINRNGEEFDIEYGPRRGAYETLEVEARRIIDTYCEEWKVSYCQEEYELVGKK